MSELSKVASDPVVPDMPVFCMSLTAWAEFYADDLRTYFYDRFGRYLDSDEYLLRSQQLFDLQKLRDSTP